MNNNKKVVRTLISLSLMLGLGCISLTVQADPNTAVANPYGLASIWKEGDYVAKITLMIMLIMSMGSWYLIIVKSYEQYRIKKQKKQSHSQFWAAASLSEGVEHLAKHSAYHLIAEKAYLSEQNYATHMRENIDFNSWVSMHIQRGVEHVQAKLSGGLAFLATVGSTAPFVGLFGTVWGIYHALTAIGISGQASIDKVAGPVGEALIMTAVGLAVAVPAVLGYNWLVRRNKQVLDELRGFGADLHSLVLSGNMSPISQVEQEVSTQHKVG